MSSELIGFPIVNQLDPNDTLDGRISENREFNCVLASLCACLYYYHPELKSKVTPDSVKDAVLGEAYANKGTDAAWFVTYLAQFGVKLYAVAAQNLAVMAHQLIQKGLPAVFTEVDPYVDTSQPQYQGWTHVGVFFKEDPGLLTAMDPFGGIIISKKDSDWPLVGNQLWTMEKTMTNTPGTPAGWTDDGTTLTAPNGHKVVAGFRKYILDPKNTWNTGNVPLEEEQSLNPVEESNPALGAGSQQVFRWTVLEWTAKQGVFPAWSGQEFLKVRTDRDALRKYAADLKSRMAQINSVSKV